MQTISLKKTIRGISYGGLITILFICITDVLGNHLSGAYVGILAGWQNSHIRSSGTCYLSTAFFQNLPPLRCDSNGALAGICLGYDICIHDILLGAEILGNFSSGKSTITDPASQFNGSPVATPFQCHFSPLSNIEITGRIGYALGAWLPFIKMGWGVNRYCVKAFSPIVPALTVHNVQGRVTGGLSSFILGGGIDFSATSHIIIGLSASVYFGRKTTLNIRGQNIYAQDPLGLTGEAINFPAVFSATNVFMMVELKYKFPSTRKFY